MAIQARASRSLRGGGALQKNHTLNLLTHYLFLSLPLLLADDDYDDDAGGDAPT